MFEIKWSLKFYQTLVNRKHRAYLSYHQNTKWLVTFCEVCIHYVIHRSYECRIYMTLFVNHTYNATPLSVRSSLQLNMTVQ